MTRNLRRAAIFFIVLLGLVNMFADMTYEGGRSITGQYLAVLGATGAIVGTVAGLGELIGYALRSISGYVSDRTGKYWLITFIGYAINLGAVPLLALTDNWQTAAFLILLERFGKAIRYPAAYAMLSYATQQTGRGWGFGLHRSMDRLGAVSGPLIVSLVLAYKGSYQIAFAVLAIPAIFAMITLTIARWQFPRPDELEIPNPSLVPEGFSKRFWIYIAGISLVAAGFVDFSLIAFHFQKTSEMAPAWIPALFAIAAAVDGITSLILGRIYDKIGMMALVWVTSITAFFVPFVFLDGFSFALLGLVLWGVGLGAQESVMRAAVANFVAMNKRGTAFGIMNMCFGIAWFIGSALIGVLYDISIMAVIVVSMTFQFASIPFFLAAIPKAKTGD